MPDLYYLYLKYPDKKTAEKELSIWENDQMNVSVDRIGITINQIDTGEVDEEGLPKFRYTQNPGWFANVVSTYKIESTLGTEIDNPVRVFA